MSTTAQRLRRIGVGGGSVTAVSMMAALLLLLLLSAATAHAGVTTGAANAATAAPAKATPPTTTATASAPAAPAPAAAAAAAAVPSGPAAKAKPTAVLPPADEPKPAAPKPAAPKAAAKDSAASEPAAPKPAAAAKPDVKPDAKSDAKPKSTEAKEKPVVAAPTAKPAPSGPAATSVLEAEVETANETPGATAVTVTPGTLAAASEPGEAKVAVAGAPTKAEAIAATVATLGKADDKATEGQFKPVAAAPIGGVRLVKDIITGKLSPLQAPTTDAAAAPATTGATVPAKDGKAAGSETATKPAVGTGDAAATATPAGAKLSAVAAAALAASKNLPGVTPPAPRHERTKKEVIVVAGDSGGSGSGDNKADVGSSATPAWRNVPGFRGGGKKGKKDKDKERGGRPFHIHVGTAAGVDDVVSDGALRPAFNVTDKSAPQDADRSAVAASVDYSDFFLWRTQPDSEAKGEGEGGAKGGGLLRAFQRRVITAQKPFVLVNNSEVVRATLVMASWGSRHMTPVPLSDSDSTTAAPAKGDTEAEAEAESEAAVVIVDPVTKKPVKKHELLFGLQYECVAEGSALVTVVVRLFELTSGTKASENVRWSFLKRCHKPSAAADAAALTAAAANAKDTGAAGAGAGAGASANVEGNLALPGLLIGSRYNTQDIVAHGETASLWSTVGDAARTPLHHYGPGVDGAKWWLRYEPDVNAREVANITANKAVFDVDDPSVLALVEAGELTERSTPLRPGRTFTLSVTFTCKKAGNSTVTAIINLPDAGGADGGAPQKVSFSFVKQCEGLRAAEGSALSGIDIWLGDKFEYVEVEAEPEPEPAAVAAAAAAGEAAPVPAPAPASATVTKKVLRLADVVRNGNVLDEWRTVQDESAESTTVRSALADADTKFVSFTVELRPAFHDVEYDPPVVSSYSPGGDVVLHPKVSGSIMESSRLQSRRPRFIVLEFGCIKEGDAVVTLKLPLRPAGSLQFNIRKSCVLATADDEEEAAQVSEYSSGASLVPLPGLHIGHHIDTASVVRNGLPQRPYHLSDSVDALMLVRKEFQWVNFFLWKNSSDPAAKDVRFGKPELISTANIARPIMSGLGAAGGLVADNEYSSLSVTFHCFTAGNTTITLLIPLVGDEWLSARNEPVRVPPARPDPIKISFVKECAAAQDELVFGMGGVGINGFSVGTAPNASDVVLNGFPQPLYYGQRKLARPQWDSIIVPAASPSTTLHMHYHSKDGALNRVMGTEIVFQSPVVVSHTPTARPVLAGPAAEGGVLLRDGAALPLEVNFNCRYAGLAVVTIILPLVPHGQISVTIPKQCDGDTPAHLHGAKIVGLHVGTSREGSEVVRDGQTSPAYVAVATRKFAEHKVRSDEANTTFWIRKTGLPMRALEPLIYAHKAIVNVRVTHALLVNSSALDEDAQGDDEIELNDEVEAINITYACVHQGRTDITVTINLLPRGQLQWTWEKQCDDVDADWSAEQHPTLKGVGTGAASDVDSEYEKYLRLKESESLVDTHVGAASISQAQSQAEGQGQARGQTESDFGAGSSEWDHDFELGAPVHMREEYDAWKLKQKLAAAFGGGGGGGGAAAAAAAGAEKRSGGGGGFLIFDTQPRSGMTPGPGMSSPTDDASSPAWNAVPDFNPHSSLDHTNADQLRALSASSLSYLQIGTGRSGPQVRDVFERSLPSLRYQMKSKAALDIAAYAVVKPDQQTSTFYLSTVAPTPAGPQKYGRPTVQMDPKFLPYLRPTLLGPNGAPATGGELVAGEEAHKLELQYRCVQGGVFAVGVRVPVGDPARKESALFRVVKICPNLEVHEEFAWTAGRVFSLIGLVVAVAALLAGFVFMRRVFRQKTLANTMYAPVQTENI